MISVGFRAGLTPYFTSDRGWPSRLCESSCLKYVPRDSLLRGTGPLQLYHCCEHLCSLGSLPNFQIPVEKIWYLFSASVTEGEAKSVLCIFSRMVICTAMRSWSLEVLCKLRPVFYHYQQTPLFPELLGWDLVSRQES